MSPSHSAVATCVFGGAFDPVHNGHLLVAANCIKRFNIQRFIWVPTFLPPHKDSSIASFHHRTTMLKCLCSGKKQQLVSNIEASLPQPSFTSQTIKMLKDKFGQGDGWYLLIGADNWLTFREWHEPEAILKEIQIIVYPRPGYSVSTVPERVFLLRAPVSHFSSTKIREQLALCENSEKIGVPAPVKEYIKRHRLYGYRKERQSERGCSSGGKEAETL